MSDPIPPEASMKEKQETATAKSLGVDQEGSTTSTNAHASSQIAPNVFICCFNRVEEGHSPDCARATELMERSGMASLDLNAGMWLR